MGHAFKYRPVANLPLSIGLDHLIFIPHRNAHLPRGPGGAQRPIFLFLPGRSKKEAIVATTAYGAIFFQIAKDFQEIPGRLTVVEQAAALGRYRSDLVLNPPFY